MERKKITIPDLLNFKKQNRKITMLTAYDFPMSVALEKAAIDIILVGDSLGNVILGYESTVPVTMDEMLHHTKAVSRGRKKSLLVADMPFMSFNVTSRKTIINAGKFIKEAGADAVKLEGANPDIVSIIKSVVSSGIPVMGHLGLTPQTATALGGYKVQGKDEESAEIIMRQALALEKAGCFSIVFECIPETLASDITIKLKIPTIGIGAGKGCDGQVLVTHDLLGLGVGFTPKFVKKYTDLSSQIDSAIENFREEVIMEKFPAPEHCFKIK
ncbi:MAG: 3-methyl-2-oxobutanoate hydroxymethyltransferase [Candidatus Omnitrophica bacterium]|nr:3-methyl-2-oxobutanoate hydroxymethyltransferase [Candidatus Omnitrophota bacterium]